MSITAIGRVSWVIAKSHENKRRATASNMHAPTIAPHKLLIARMLAPPATVQPVIGVPA